MANVTQLSVLSQEETVSLDPACLDAIYASMGDSGAEDVICRTMEEIAVRLSHTERLYRQGTFEDLPKSARNLIRLAETVGMSALAQVAADVVHCVEDEDPVALGATLARLLRVGERSLTAIWELHDIPG